MSELQAALINKTSPARKAQPQQPGSEAPAPWIRRATSEAEKRQGLEVLDTSKAEGELDIPAIEHDWVLVARAEDEPLLERVLWTRS